MSIVNHPGRWGYVVPGNRTMEEIIAMITQMGKALNFLHQQDWYFNSGSLSTEKIESWIAVPGHNEVRLADLSTCQPIAPENRSLETAQDVKFLAQVLFYLTAGLFKAEPDVELTPDEFKPYIAGAINGHYATPMDLMRDLSRTPEPTRQLLTPIHGQATHPGKKHVVNEDAVASFTYNKQQSGHSVPVAFYLVADGMGGHDAGDLASRMVNQTVTNWVLQVQVLPDLRKTTRKLTSENIPADLLERATQEANTALHRHAQSKNSDLGSTITAALLIGNTATVANVGDSRTYRLRQGRLDPITRDHSLVARLVETNVISADEVRTHPQRNQIYRSLGHKPEIKVDTFTVPLQKSDVLVLCSDGLWEMVLEEEIKHIIQNSRTPQEACDRLIAAANESGGEDNISVIVVEME
ncbi:MAG: Stp1/IreP family PP2C-type Ser/Thr phosphatase [Anaerolineae bacterium]|nr:Stp1/IreP family PP2C-type Ser/Thr phosphatase [Anaerolineae bacterium]